MCTLFYLFIYYIYVCLQNVNFLANKTLHYMKSGFVANTSVNVINSLIKRKFWGLMCNILKNHQPTFVKVLCTFNQIQHITLCLLRFSLNAILSH